MEGGAATVKTWRKEKQKLRKKLPEDKGRKTEKEKTGGGRREGKRSRPPPLQSHRKWRRDLTKRWRNLTLLREKGDVLSLERTSCLTVACQDCGID
jgi:hypothetical protein